jgi:hypothetical protein
MLVYGQDRERNRGRDSGLDAPQRRNSHCTPIPYEAARSPAGRGHDRVHRSRQEGSSAASTPPLWPHSPRPRAAEAPPAAGRGGAGARPQRRGLPIAARRPAPRREGPDDDLVLALAIAAWEGERNLGLGLSCKSVPLSALFALGADAAPLQKTLSAASVGMSESPATSRGATARPSPFEAVVQ